MKLDLSIPFDRNKAETYFKKLMEEKARVEIKKHVSKRTNLQNAYWHVACTILSNETGCTLPEIKKIIKDHLEFMVYTKGGHQFYRSSADLDKEEFINLINFTRDFGESHGYYIPTPEEYYESQFEIERQLHI